MPTNSEPVARIRAFSSLRLTPAMDATSLMSSSSLKKRVVGSGLGLESHLTVIGSKTSHPVRRNFMHFIYFVFIFF